VPGATERYDELAASVRRRPPRLGGVRLVAVDGPAGSGKSTFAGRLAAALRAGGDRVAEIHTDDLLDGWSDQVAFWPRLERWILDPLRRGQPGRYRVYDWPQQRFGRRWHPVAVPDVLIVEGVTAARRMIRPELTLAVFVTADPAVRLRRGLDRDGEALREEWLRWMAGEERHFAEDATAQQADVIVDGASSLSHDPAVEFVRRPPPGECG
jgi:uridine kinase